MASHVVSVTEFKAKCLALLDDVSTTGDTITVTKRGKPLATVSPAKAKPYKSSKGIWKGKIHIPDDVLMDDTSELWEVVREKEISRF